MQAAEPSRDVLDFFRSVLAPAVVHAMLSERGGGVDKLQDNR